MTSRNLIDFLSFYMHINNWGRLSQIPLVLMHRYNDALKILKEWKDYRQEYEARYPNLEEFEFSVLNDRSEIARMRRQMQMLVARVSLVSREMYKKSKSLIVIYDLFIFLQMDTGKQKD